MTTQNSNNNVNNNSQDNNNNNNVVAPIDVATLLQAHAAMTSAATLTEQIKAKHESTNAMITAIGLNKTQAEKLRASNGITDSLENDLKALEIDESTAKVLATLSDTSAAVWTQAVKELQRAQVHINRANELRAALGQQEFFIAHSGVVKSGAKSIKGQASSEAHESSRAMYMRPGVVYMSYDNMTIEWRATLESHTLSVLGTNVSRTWQQGETGLHSAIVSFVRETLGRETSNLSLPQKLVQAGYNKDNVYMYVAPTAETEEIKQPQRVPQA